MKALIPLKYCEYRVSNGESVDVCPIFAGHHVEGMSFCEGHGELVAKAIEDSGVELIRTTVSKLKEA